MEEFRAAKGLKARGTVTHEILKNLPDLDDKTAAATEIIPTLNSEIVTISAQPTGHRAGGHFCARRHSRRSHMGAAPVEGELMTNSLSGSQEAGKRSGRFWSKFQQAKHRRALESFKASNPDHWPEAAAHHIEHCFREGCRPEVANALISGGKLDGVKEVLARLISQHQGGQQRFAFFGSHCERSDSFADILEPEVFRAMLTAMERDQFNEKAISPTNCAITYWTTKRCSSN